MYLILEKWTNEKSWFENISDAQACGKQNKDSQRSLYTNLWDLWICCIAKEIKITDVIKFAYQLTLG